MLRTIILRQIKYKHITLHTYNLKAIWYDWHSIWCFDASSSALISTHTHLRYQKENILVMWVEMYIFMWWNVIISHYYQSVKATRGLHYGGKYEKCTFVMQDERNIQRSSEHYCHGFPFSADVCHSRTVHSSVFIK